MKERQNSKSTKVKVREKPNLPTEYKVVFHNDDHTTMEFVVMVLMKIFRKSESEATRIMFQVHNDGKGIAGIYSYDIAQTKADQTIQLARANGYPLQLTVEPV
jgi:ATP-dependent Clp protease adaptor protein ClpS